MLIDNKLAFTAIPGVTNITDTASANDIFDPDRGGDEEGFIIDMAADWAAAGDSDNNNRGIGRGSALAVNFVVTTAFVDAGASGIQFYIREHATRTDALLGAAATAGLIIASSPVFVKAQTTIAGFSWAIPLPPDSGPYLTAGALVDEVGDTTAWTSGMVASWLGDPIPQGAGYRPDVAFPGQAVGTLPPATGLPATGIPSV